MAGADDERGHTADPLAPNYQYWREEGGKWLEEYEWRKRHRPYYHVQELILLDYFAHHAPCRVLDFGCGVGRHLRNLVRIPGLEVHGYDQSRAMVQGCLAWTTQDWIDTHVTVGEPTGTLPFRDGEFDIVYSSEVLIHVRPEDLDGVLAELLRICRGHLLHIEPSPGVELFWVHEGCWNHDLAAAYARLQRRCELLPSGIREQTPYRVEVREGSARYTWPPLMLELLQRLETNLAEGFASLDADLERHRTALADLERRLAEAHTARAALEGTNESLHASLRAVTADLQLLERRRADEAERVACLLAERDAFIHRTYEVLRR